MKVFQDIATVDIQGDSTLQLIENQQGLALYKVRGLEPKLLCEIFGR